MLVRIRENSPDSRAKLDRAIVAHGNSLGGGWPNPHAARFSMNPTTPAQHRQAIWMLVLGNLLWGVSFPLIKALV